MSGHFSAKGLLGDVEGERTFRDIWIELEEPEAL